MLIKLVFSLPFIKAGRHASGVLPCLLFRRTRISSQLLRWVPYTRTEKRPRRSRPPVFPPIRRGSQSNTSVILVEVCLPCAAPPLSVSLLFSAALSLPLCPTHDYSVFYPSPASHMFPLSLLGRSFSLSIFDCLPVCLFGCLRLSHSLAPSFPPTLSPMRFRVRVEAGDVSGI